MSQFRTKILTITGFFYLIFFSSAAFAFFCPTNFNQINVGDTLEQVKQQCGKADSEETKEEKDEGPQEWIYFIPQTVSMMDMSQTQGTLRTSFSFDESGKAVNISVNGIGVGSTTICGGTIQLGDKRETIQTVCGKPSYINKQNLPSAMSNQKARTITKLTYTGRTTAILVFENGMLKEKQ